MKKTTSIILIVIIVLTIIKFLLSYFTGPTVFTDEYIYTKMAQSFYDNLNFNIHGMNIAPYPPLYPILLSVSFMFKNLFYSYVFMKLINAIISTLIIIPAYLIAREFLDEKKSLFISIIIAILPMNFSFSSYIMSENIFYTLYLTSIYLIYKSFTSEKIRYCILAGIAIGLTILTKFLGASLCLIVLFLFLFYLFNKKSYLKQSIIIALIILFILSPFIINNGIKYGFTLPGIIGEYSKEAQESHPTFSIINLLLWIIVYIVYLILSSGFFLTFLNLSWKQIKENKNYKILFFIAIFTFLIIIYGAANHAAKSPFKELALYGLTGRPIGRYIDTALPILLIFSIITFFKKADSDNLRKQILWIIPLIFSFILFYFSLFPVNNMSLTLYGILNEIIKNLAYSKFILVLITILIFLIIKILYRKQILTTKHILIIITLFFITTSIASYAVGYYNYKTNWENNPQLKLSKWISHNIPIDKTIVIDEEYCGIVNKENINNICSLGKSTALTGFWIRNNIIIGNKMTKGDYLITLSKLNKEQIKKTENEIYLYKI